MSGSASTLKPNDPPKPPMTEARIWLAACGAVAVGIAIAALFDLREGVDLASIASTKTGAALGLMLAWGTFHLASRRPNDGFAIVGVAGTLFASSGRHGTFTKAFVITLVASAGGLAFFWLVGFRVPRGSMKTSTPQSGHLLYDADVDGAT
ncbi:hypothetical protein [Paludisphaera borealis]|uniref:Uncharacterized protein n=1 Tax=Paludisphaera borealis TaxID=1387353 RepID=A0A1U7CQC7_9BACT|nr:hypothetical protein [Paludisphaera borealis]APW61150.1 hypothetical protein BSF38_02654 [Paludisphaera borealis]